MVLWRRRGDNFRNSFSSKETWSLTRQAQPMKEWNKGIWFTHATPKYSWLANLNRLATVYLLELTCLKAYSSLHRAGEISSYELSRYRAIIQDLVKVVRRNPEKSGVSCSVEIPLNPEHVQQEIPKIMEAGEIRALAGEL
ncbi:unnamed protein product [Microthlaspi erraticum]|uniref:Uncharacterized protein n=1 Tax=Microthlaspi erraticum TaxID=1685480 RepID=A0A6D2JZX5_9BRAS|nr:unnamed protein product [Microthlaspi erraticum]